METILQLLIVAAIAISPSIMKWAKDKIKKTGEAFSKNLKTRADISAIMKEIQIKMDANRVALFEYSNTEKAINGLPFDYVTITYEETDETTVPIGSTFRKIPIGQFAAQLMEIDKAEKWVMQDMSNKDKDVVYNLRKYGVEKEYHFKISKHLRDGVLSVIFMKEVPDFTEEQIDYLNFKCWEIYNLMLKLK